MFLYLKCLIFSHLSKDTMFASHLQLSIFGESACTIMVIEACGTITYLATEKSSPMSRVVPFWDFFLMGHSLCYISPNGSYLTTKLPGNPKLLQPEHHTKLWQEIFNIRKLLHPSKPKKIEAGEDIR